ncbi:MAG: adenylate/guanylate cyclase domain-containing protein [Spartobacteria bacterium]|nr:adenylate/guanylate cyclase domain-containing protein [Spartobacteria bacterium]
MVCDVVSRYLVAGGSLRTELGERDCWSVAMGASAYMTFLNDYEEQEIGYYRVAAHMQWSDMRSYADFMPRGDHLDYGHSSLFNATGDSDNIIRRTPLMWCQNGQVYPALSLVSLGLFVDQNAYGIHFYEEPSLGVQSVQISERTIPVDGMGRLLLNFRTDAFPHFFAADILDGLVDSSVITGRLVLVGTSAAGLRDLVATPLHSEFPGIDVHATAIENMLSGDVLRQPSWIYLADIGVILLLGLLIMWVTSRAGALFSIVFTLILLCGLWSISLWLIHSFHLVIPPIATGGAVLLISGCVILAKYWIEESRRLHFRHIFGNMVSTQVLKFMEDHPDSHALNACLTALDQVRRLQQLNSELREMFGVQLHFRVGINTGPVTAGNMGSRRRFEFTVLGDTVNQAARLESISKFYGTRILCGEMTRDAVCNVIATRKLDRIVLKGKTQPVAVYEIISTLEELTAADAERIECYEKALLSYFDRQWDHAAVLLSELLMRYPDDGPSLVLSKRIQQYQNTPPPPDWNGAFVAMIK